MTAKEARDTVNNSLKRSGLVQQMYQYFQEKIKEAVLKDCFGCEIECPITSSYIDSKGNFHQIENLTRIEQVLRLLREDGFCCRISKGEKNWKIEVEW